MMHASRVSIPLIAAFLLSGTLGVFAQTFPTKPVRIISPYPAGISPDVMMRLIAERLTKAWNQPVVLEARPGGSGVPAMEAVKAAAADGHTLALPGDAQLAINPVLHHSLSYDPQADFTPVMRLFSSPFYIVVSAKGPYRTIQDLIVDAQSAPNKVSYGAIFSGSPAHIGAAQFALSINAQMVYVPYRDVQQMLIQIVNGDLGWTLTTTATAAPFLENGTLKALAIADTKRSPNFPEIPTIAESGGPEVTAKAWLALVAPRGTRAEVIQQINRDFRMALEEPTIQERLRIFGFTLEPSSPDELRQLIADELNKNRELLKRIGLSPLDRP